MATVRWVFVSVLCLATCHFCICASHDFKSSGRSDQHSDFSQRYSIKPSIHHGREKRHISHTRQSDGHVSEVSLTFELQNRTFTVNLHLNKDLLGGDYFEKHSANGRPVVERPKGIDVDLCHYQGRIRDVADSWAALSTCEGIQGVVFDGNELLYLEPGGNASVDDEHFVYRHSDLRSNFACGSGPSVSQAHSSHDHLRVRRSAAGEVPAVRGPFKANSRSRYIELVLVVDNEIYKQHGDVKKVYRRCKDIANIVNALYAPINIFVALVGVVVWTEKDEIQLSMKADETLTNFLHYRRVRLAKEHPNDNAQLLTGIQFQGGIVGKALKGPMCTYEFSGGVAMDHSNNVGLVAATVAHEMGHNFGMEHDNDSLCTCPDKTCIMAASSGSISPTHWSSCSLENLALAFEHGMDYCLRNKPTSLFETDGPECGNMFVEPGEECDCGRPENCDNPCCNPYTCKLYTNATCATGECCDLETCSYKNAGTECRAANHECDLPEYCSGKNESCPPDLHKINGLPCGKDKAYCFDGSCRSHTDQCRLLWGISGKGSEVQCYKQNSYGNKTGNCGYDKYNQNFTRCRDEDILCGLLHCSHLNERLEFGMESVAILSHSFFNSGGRIIPCRTANVDLGLQDVDPGLVPNGAKCGDNKMCVNQKCVPVADHYKGGCPQNCNNNGVCNSLGKCHCNVGFAPPYCDYPGPGGSEDSGPASNPHVSNAFVTALYIIFLGIVPVVALFLCCCYCRRNPRERSQLWAKIQRAPKLSLPTRSSPDFTRPPSSSSSSTGSIPPGVRYRRLFWPFHWFSGPRQQPPRVTVEVKNLDISQPLPLQSTANGSATTTNTFSQSFGRSLFGQYNGFTLSPLSEQPDSSFDSVGSAEVNPVPKAHPLPAKPLSAVKPMPVQNNSVSSRANFFSNQNSQPLVSVARSAPAPPAKPAASSAAPATTTKTSTTVVSTSKSAQPVAHTEIIITKTVIPPVTDSKEINEPQSVKRPLSSPNAFSVKAIFGKEREPKAETAKPDTASLPAETSAGISVPASQSGVPASSGGTSTLQRVASLFKPNVLLVPAEPAQESSTSSTLPRNQSVKATKINRESLRQLEISNPIPQHVELPAKVVPVRPAPEPPTSPTKIGFSSTLPRLPKNKVHFAEDVHEKLESRNSVERAESMRLRSEITRPNIPQFGSMRAKRPVSMPFSRPTAPPPNPPTLQQGSKDQQEYPYDDCVANPDAIYASIEDLAEEPSSKLDETSSSSTSDGLLLEIVSELRKKNPTEVPDIYTAAAKKNPPSKSSDTSNSSTVPRSSSFTTPLASATATAFSSITSRPFTSLASAKTSTASVIPVVPTTSSTTPTTASNSQGYKPYSAAAASRNRYLTSTPATPTTTSVGTTSSILSSWWNKQAAVNATQPSSTATTSVLNTRPSVLSSSATTTTATPTLTTGTAPSSVKTALSALQAKNLAEDKPAAVPAKPLVTSVLGKAATPLPAPPVPTQPPVAATSEVAKPISAVSPVKITMADVSSKIAARPMSPVNTNATTLKSPTSQTAKTLVKTSPTGSKTSSTLAPSVKSAAGKAGSKTTNAAIRLAQPAAAAAKPTTSNPSSVAGGAKKSIVQSMQQKFDNSSAKPKTTATSVAASKAKPASQAKK